MVISDFVWLGRLHLLSLCLCQNGLYPGWYRKRSWKSIFVVFVTLKKKRPKNLFEQPENTLGTLLRRPWNIHWFPLNPSLMPNAPKILKKKGWMDKHTEWQHQFLRCSSQLKSGTPQGSPFDCIIWKFLFECDA